MHADSSAAPGTPPPKMIFLYESFNSVFFDALQVVYRAYVVLEPVAFVQPVQSLARHFVALEAEFRVALARLHACLHHAPGACDRLASVACPTPGTRVSLTQVC